MKSLLALSASLLFLSSSAHAYLIDFGSSELPIACANNLAGEGKMLICAAGIAVNQSYGDVPGVVDVSYTDLNDPTRSLVFWDTNYNNLYGVAIASGTNVDSAARIDLVPASGLQVNLASFRLGAYNKTTRGTNVLVLAIGDSTPLYAYSGGVGNGSVDSTLFDLDVSSASGITIAWSDSARDVGIDQISFTVTPVPEPGSAALAAVAVVALIALARRRDA
jgi:MYXO-CTERM domain-containing protein